ncbi:MAG: hypothetical protein NTZ53_02340 [Cyanobacteria bacterium]|nr:hypothetical protein [Cyanobacteriota bacterium]
MKKIKATLIEAVMELINILAQSSLANFSRRYGQIAIKIAGTAGVAACSIWFGAWFPDAQQLFKLKCNENPSCKIKEDQKPSFLEVTLNHAPDYRAPVPYLLITLALAVISVMIDVRDCVLRKRFDTITNEKNGLVEDLASEKENHVETMKEYNGAIEYILKYMFCATNWWAASCRITIYRHTGDRQLKRIFRHAGQTRYESCGRIKIPENEGAVGAAWLNDGFFKWNNHSNPKTQTYLDDLKKNLQIYSAEMPKCDLTMPSREYVALAVRSLSGQKIAIVVIESTEPGTINETDIQFTINGENHQIVKQITNKSKLDEILNPDSN